MPSTALSNAALVLTFIAKDTDKAPLVQILANDTPVKVPKLYDAIGMASVEPVPVMDDQSWSVVQDYFIKPGLQQQKVDLTKFIAAFRLPNRLLISVVVE